MRKGKGDATVTSTAQTLKGKVIKVDALCLRRMDKRSKSLTIAVNNGLEGSYERINAIDDWRVSIEADPILE